MGLSPWLPAVSQPWLWHVVLVGSSSSSSLFDFSGGGGMANGEWRGITHLHIIIDTSRTPGEHQMVEITNEFVCLSSKR